MIDLEGEALPPDNEEAALVEVIRLVVREAREGTLEATEALLAIDVIARAQLARSSRRQVALFACPACGIPEAVEGVHVCPRCGGDR